MTLESTIEKLVDSKIEKAMQGGSQTVLAEYKGTDSQGKGWVVIAGSTESTPITRATVEASEGDTVSVTVGDGKCVMDANISNPSAGVVGVRKVAKTAEQAADDAEKAIMYSQQASSAALSAQASARAAGIAAEDARVTAESVRGIAVKAQEDAAAAASAASDAQESADEAHDTAIDAQAAADTAQASANSAMNSANSALLNLSEIEKVVGAAEWIYSHGTYRNYPPYVTEFDASAIYYVPSASSPTGYAIVDNPTEQGMWDYELTADTTVDPEKTYYVQVTTYTYALTTDTEIVAGKAYYTYDPENDEYDLVDEPVAEDLPTYYERTDTVTYEPVENPVDSELPNYYERSSLYYVLDISESVQNYIATHLALNNDGLHIFGNPGDYNALLGIDGLDIRESGGTSVAKYGEDFRVGKVSGVYLQGTPTRLAFTSSAGDIVYFGLDEQQVWSMFMEQAYVRDMIRFGNYAWVKRANGNLTMKYLED